MDHKPPITKLLSMKPLNDYFESLPKGFVTGESALDGMLTGGRISSNGGLRTGFNMYRLQHSLTEMNERGVPIICIDLEGGVTNETIDKVLALYKKTHTSDKE